MQLRYQIHGSRTGPLVTFLHGWLGSAEEWREITALLDSDLCLLSIDLPGHGRSAEVGHYYDMQETCSSVIETIQSHTTAPSVLIGYSMGGRVALGCALRAPRLFRGLILENTNPGIESETERRERVELDNLRAQQLEEMGLAEFLPRWYEAELFASLRSDGARFEQLLRKRSVGKPLALAAALRNLSVGRQESYWERLEELKQPLLVVAGETDGKYTEISRRICECLPRAELAPVAAGHNVHFEQPQAFAEQVTQFLARV